MTLNVDAEVFLLGSRQSKVVVQAGMSKDRDEDDGSKGNAEEYTRLKNELIQNIKAKQEVEAKLEKLEDSIYECETEYFNESTYGNIVKGFDSFTKSNTNTANKKRITYTDDDHIFSLSSVNYIKGLMKRQGLVANGGAARTDDFDDYEDTVEPRADSPSSHLAHGHHSRPGANSVLQSNGLGQSTPGRKRKPRTFDD